MKEFKIGFYIFFKSFREKKGFFVILGLFFVISALLIFKGLTKEGIGFSFYFLPYVVLFLTSNTVYEEISSPICENLMFVGLNRKRYFLLKNLFVWSIGLLLWISIVLFSLFIKELNLSKAFLSLVGIFYFGSLGVLLNYKMKSYTGSLALLLIGLLLTILCVQFSGAEGMVELHEFSFKNFTFSKFFLFLLLALTFPILIWGNLDLVFIQIPGLFIIIFLQERYLKWKFSE